MIPKFGSGVSTKFTSRTLSAVSDVRISTGIFLPSGRNISREAVLVVMLNVSCKQKKSTVNGAHRAGTVSDFLYLGPQGIRHPETHRADYMDLVDGVLRGRVG